VRKLRDDFARVLRRAIHNEVLSNGEYDVGTLLQLSEGAPGGRGGTFFELVGGPLDFKRLGPGQTTPGCFVREDGAVVHFHLTVLERPGMPIELDSYGFEIYFPERDPISFVRFDLNPRGHSNEHQGLRSHLHPGHEDLQLPSPMLSPVEALNFLLYRCRLKRETRRTP
jgi:hypothetical protein